MLLFITNKPQLPRGKLDGWLFTNPSEINLKANHDKSGWYAAGQTACYCLLLLGSEIQCSLFFCLLHVFDIFIILVFTKCVIDS